MYLRKLSHRYYCIGIRLTKRQKKYIIDFIACRAIERNNDKVNGNSLFNKNFLAINYTD